jgi:hypothetical protein
MLRNGIRTLSPSPIRQGAFAAGTIVAAGLAVAAPAFAQQPPQAPGAQAASEALAVAAATLEPQGTAEPAVEATLAMNALAAALPELEGAERKRARSLLARPTDGAADQFRDGYPPSAPVAVAESAHFCVYWVNDPRFEDAPDLTDADTDGVPDYVEAILEIAEHSYSVEVAPGALGWAPPKPDTQGCGADPSARADVYLKQLGTEGLFGYESPDPGQGRTRSQYGYMVIDDDYAPAEYGYPDPLEPARVTFAHEFNHLLQQNYDSFQDRWMFEATATWSEDFVYPAVNDYVTYVRAFASSPGTPITDPTAVRGLRIYGAAVWNHWLSGPGGGYGVDAVLRAWEVSGTTRPRDFAVAAYDKSIRDSKGDGFSREFAAFAAATAEWRTGFGGFPDRALYPDMKRKGSLSKGHRKRFRLDHTAIRLLDVRARGKGAIRLSVRAEKGVRAGLAIVARAGDPLSGRVTRKSEYLRRGGNGSVTLDSPGRFDRITAVLANADGRVRGFDGSDWIYRKDKRDFRVRLKRARVGH